jgi:NitT/TauT family transport system substrate-binding protein
MRLNPAGTTPRNRIFRPYWARSAAALVSGLAVLAAAGCASSSGAGGGTVSTAITIAAVPGIDNAPLYLAKHDGMFAAAGLKNVSILAEKTEAGVFEALKSGQAQIADTDYGDLFFRESQGGQYKILADGYDAATGSLEILTLPSSGITSPAQLARGGVTVGMPDDDLLPVPSGSGAPTSLESAAATSVMSSSVSDPSVKWAPMSQAAEVTDLEHHKDGIRAILVSQPYILQAETQAGAVEVLDACSGATANLPLSGYVASSTWVKAHPTAVADFQAAMAKAQVEASMAYPAQHALAAFTGLALAQADLVTIGTYPTSTSVSDLDRVSQLMWGSHMTPSQVFAGPMIVG